MNAACLPCSLLLSARCRVISMDRAKQVALRLLNQLWTFRSITSSSFYSTTNAKKFTAFYKRLLGSWCNTNRSLKPTNSFWRASIFSMPNANWPWKWKPFCQQLASIRACTSNRRIIRYLGAPTSKRANPLLHKSWNCSKNQECSLFQGLTLAERALRSKPLASYNWCCRRAC